MRQPAEGGSRGQRERRRRMRLNGAMDGAPDNDANAAYTRDE